MIRWHATIVVAALIAVAGCASRDTPAAVAGDGRVEIGAPVRIDYETAKEGLTLPMLRMVG